MQPSNELSPIEITDEKVTYLSDKHPLKAKSPIVLTDDGMTIFDRHRHKLNEDFPIEITEEGIEKLVNNEHQ